MISVISRAISVDRDDDRFHIENGDEEVDDEEETEAELAEVVDIPSKLKAVIKFGYDEGWKSAFEGVDFNKWIESVFTHTQAHYKHPSLGTKITFEVLFSFRSISFPLYHAKRFQTPP